MTRTRLFGWGSAATSRLPASVAMPTTVFTMPYPASPARLIASAGSAALCIDATRLMPDRNRISIKILRFLPKYPSPVRKACENRSFFSCAGEAGMRMNSSRLTAAAANVTRSNSSTLSSPANAIIAAACAGVAMLMMEFDTCCRLLARCTCSLGVSSVTATSEAGCCTVFISPLIALMPYRCQMRRLPVFSSKSTPNVVNAASASHTSSVFFLFQRSESVPANMLIPTYGA